MEKALSLELITDLETLCSEVAQHFLIKKITTSKLIQALVSSAEGYQGFLNSGTMKRRTAVLSTPAQMT